MQLHLNMTVRHGTDSIISLDFLRPNLTDSEFLCEKNPIELFLPRYKRFSWLFRYLSEESIMGCD